jgi:hypothetical protein
MATKKEESEKPESNVQKLRRVKRVLKEVLDNPGKMTHANFLRVKAAYSTLCKYRGV